MKKAQRAASTVFVAGRRAATVEAASRRFLAESKEELSAEDCRRHRDSPQFQLSPPHFPYPDFPYFPSGRQDNPAEAMKKENSKYRKKLKRLPVELRQVLDALESEYTVESYAPQYLGWAAEITIGFRRFRLVMEFKHVLVSEMIGGVEHLLSSRTGEDIRSTTRSVAQLITRDRRG